MRNPGHSRSGDARARLAHKPADPRLALPATAGDSCAPRASPSRSFAAEIDEQLLRGRAPRRDGHAPRAAEGRRGALRPPPRGARRRRPLGALRRHHRAPRRRADGQAPRRSTTAAGCSACSRAARTTSPPASCVHGADAFDAPAYAETTAVTFRALAEDEVRRYVATGEGVDKAGGYAVQGLASAFVERLEGSYAQRRRPARCTAWWRCSSAPRRASRPTRCDVSRRPRARDNLARGARRASSPGRPRVRGATPTIALVAVSKTWPARGGCATAYALRAARLRRELRAGARRASADALADLAELRWHFIGHLQTQQGPKYVAPFVHAAVHTVDDREARARARPPRAPPRGACSTRSSR
jgi:hypothetical protein